MAKYDESFKLEMVQKYPGGQIGHRALAGQIGLDASLLRQWINRYQVHGIDGLRKKRSHYSAHFKLNVLAQAKPQKLSDKQAAVIFDLRGGGDVVAQWRQLYDQGGAQALHPKPKGRASQPASCAQRAQAVLELRPYHPLSTLLLAAGLSRSTFYYQAKALQVGDK